MYSTESISREQINSISLDDGAFLSFKYVDLIAKVENLPKTSNLVVKDGIVYIRVGNSKNPTEFTHR